MADEPKEGQEPQEDAEAAAVWARLAPHAKKTYIETLDEYFGGSDPEPAKPGEGEGTDDGGTGGTAGAGGGAGSGATGTAGGAGGPGSPKAPAKAQGQGPDLWSQISDFAFGKPAKK